MSTLNAETTYKAFAHCLDGDVFPPSFMAGFFGMGGDDRERVSPVLGVWQGLKRYGLLEKDAFKLAIREDKISEFFEKGRLKLAAVGHGYSLKVQKINVFFDGLPAMGQSLRKTFWPTQKKHTSTPSTPTPHRGSRLQRPSGLRGTKLLRTYLGSSCSSQT